MKRERVLVVLLIVTAVLSLLMTSLATADTLPPSEDHDNPLTKTMLQKEMLASAPAIFFTATVGLDPSVCASTQTIFVPSGTEVAYCYQIKNSGDVTLTVHDLVDSELGTILSGFSFSLLPNSTVWLSQTAVITASTANSATWTAYNPGPTNSVSVLDGAAVIIDEINGCQSPNIAIPDNNVTGTVVSVNLIAPGLVTDLDIFLDMEHAWVGDLEMTLEHVASGITATLINRPGLPAVPPFGCGENDIRAIIDDEASQDVESSCPSRLALAGRLVGGDPADNSLLATFDGQEITGQWRLHVTDHAAGDTGALNHWCLLPTIGTPDMSLNPTQIEVTQPVGGQTNHTLSMQNNGNVPLHWAIQESLDGVSAVSEATPAFSHRPIVNRNPQLQPAAEQTTTHTTTTAEKGMAVYGPTAPPPTSVLYDNGPLVTLPGGGAGGADASVVQFLSLGLSTFGFGLQASLNRSVADDFTITDPNGWYIDEITTFAYQTGSSLTSTITAVSYHIWDGPPTDPSSKIIASPATSNSLTDSTWSGIYRVEDSDLGSVDRPIMQNIASGGLLLGPGTYWLEWRADGLLSSGPWGPPVTISGVVTTGNALQFINQAWEPLLDSSTGSRQDLPFIISGFVPQDIPWASVEPGSGTLPSGTTDVIVTFDSTGLAMGVYTGTLLISSNDPNVLMTPVPLMLTVEAAHLYIPFLTKE